MIIKLFYSFTWKSIIKEHTNCISLSKKLMFFDLNYDCIPFLQFLLIELPQATNYILVNRFIPKWYPWDNHNNLKQGGVLTIFFGNFKEKWNSSLLEYSSYISLKNHFSLSLKNRGELRQFWETISLTSPSRMIPGYQFFHTCIVGLLYDSFYHFPILIIITIKLFSFESL